MNLILHHFCKEFRWLRPRWALFLAVLGFDLAFNMEWVFPMQTGGVAGFSEVMGSVLWLVAWWVVLSTAPEDAAAEGRAFVWTRPLPRWSYWLARLLVWGLLLVLPMVLEVAVYLMLMDRPWHDVWLGMMEEVFAAGAMTLWVLPAAVLFRGWERYVALVIFAALWGTEYGRDVLEHVFTLMGIQAHMTYPFLEPVRFVWAAWLVGPLMVLLLMWQQRRPMTLVARHTVLAVLTLVTYGMAVSPLIESWFNRPVDEALVRGLAEGTLPNVRTKDFQVFVQTDEKLGRYLSVSAGTSFQGVPRGVIPFWHSERMSVTQAGKALPLKERRSGNRNDPQNISFQLSMRPLGRDLPSGWARDSLAVDSGEEQNRVNLPRMAVPEDLETPVDFDLELAANWARLRELGHVALKAGARIRSPEAELEVLEVRPNVGPRHQRRPGAVTLVLRQSMRTLSADHVMWPVGPMLTIHAPGKRLIWQRAVQGGGNWRAMRLGWMHTVLEITFGEVMRPGTDVTEGNLAEQQLVWIKPDYLGRSHHRVEVKTVNLGEGTRRFRAGPWTTAAVDQRANPREKFLAAARQRERPALEAPLPEVARYVAAVYSASMIYDRRTDTNSFAEPLWPGSDREAAELLAPYLVKHPELVRRLRPDTQGSFTDEVVRAALLHGRIPGFQREVAAGQAFYQRTIAVPGQPGVPRAFMGDLWMPDGKGEQTVEAVARMLETGSDEAMWGLLESEAPSVERMWRDFTVGVSAQNLRLLSREAAYRDRAIAEVNRRYEALPATAKIRDRTVIYILAAKAALGDAEALGWMLRAAGLQDDDGGGHSFAGLQDGHRALFDAEITLREVPEFIRKCRGWTAADFRYDAEKMRWVLRAEGTTPPKKP